MNVGDRVRLLHGKEEGAIVRILPGDLIEVEIEDGFVIPVMKREAVVIAKEEATGFVHRGETSGTRKPAKETISVKGLYFAFTAENEKELLLHLVNNTDLVALFAFSEETDEKTYGLSNGLVNSRSAVKLKTYAYNQMEQWPALHVQVILHRSGYFSLKPPLAKSLKIRASSFIKKKGKAPVLDQPAYLYQLDEQEGLENVDPVKIKESMLKRSSYSAKTDHTPPPSVVDLHIERLVGEANSLSGGDILDLQVATFEKALDKAIANGLDEIMFIHGVGAGVLRQIIHKRLSARKNIVFYKDAMKEKFGYGATLVKIK